MPSILGTTRGNLLNLKPQNLLIDWGKNYSRLDSGEGGADIEAMVEAILQPGKGGKPRGVLEPITVLSSRGKKVVTNKAGEPLWQVQKGFRRATAAVIAAERGWKGTIPAMLAEMDFEGSVATNLIENEARKDISVLDRAIAYGKLRDDHKWTTAQISKATGRVVDFVADHLKLYDAGAEVQALLRHDKITWANMRQVLRCPAEQQEAVAKALCGRTAIEARAVVNRVLAGGPISLGASVGGDAEGDDKGDAKGEGEGGGEGTAGGEGEDKGKGKEPMPTKKTINKAALAGWIEAQIEKLANAEGGESRLTAMQKGELLAYRRVARKLVAKVEA